MKTPYCVIRIEDESALREEFHKKLDEFLDVYSFYLAAGVDVIFDELKLKAYELRLLDPSFAFQPQAGLL